MILSIVVLSYNRPAQIERILKNFIGVCSDDFNIIIKDDFSPLQSEILSLVDDYSNLLSVGVEFFSNHKNMGYDGNLMDVFSIANSDYVFLLSDDDYVDGAKIDGLIDLIKRNEFDFYFTPYISEGVIKRVPTGNFSPKEYSEVIYNSILFSGLVYRVKAVRSLDLDYNFLSESIYSQVYIAFALMWKQKKYGVLPAGSLYLGGDGDNFFGKNQSAKNSELLSDRKKVYSDFIYQQFLLRVVDRISIDFDSFILCSFYREYGRRLISYGLRVRALGLGSYFAFLKYYFGVKSRRFLVPEISFICIILLPSWFSGLAYRLGVKFMRKSG